MGSAVILRSILYTPANHERHAAKDMAGEADGVILDLEDAVALSEKARAREAAVEILRNRSAKGPSAFVRVNGLGTPFAYDDLVAVGPMRPDGIVLPKCESARDVRIVDAILLDLEKKHGLEALSIDLIAVVETAAGLVKIDEIAGASPRVRRISLGAADLSLDAGLVWEPGNEAILWAKIRTVIASRAAGLDPPVDTVFPNLRDDEGLVGEANQAKRLGFQGKACIHPSQVELVNQVFSPTAHEVERALRLLAAFEAATSAGTASIQVGGEFVDYPVAARARRVLDLADRLARGHATGPPAPETA